MWRTVQEGWAPFWRGRKGVNLLKAIKVVCIFKALHSFSLMGRKNLFIFIWPSGPPCYVGEWKAVVKESSESFHSCGNFWIAPKALVLRAWRRCLPGWWPLQDSVPHFLLEVPFNLWTNLSQPCSTLGFGFVACYSKCTILCCPGNFPWN